MERQYIQSIATIDEPEFINVTEISPLISKCEIKVLYIGQNRNQSFITKEVATNMAETLRGVPIAGAYSNEKEDFTDHGDRMIIDNEGVKFEKLTKPYGFVSPDAKIWFQFFEDTDEFGNTTVREYMMTEGYLWTEMYKEAKDIVESGRPQSMELDENSLKGYWSQIDNTGIEFFIINDSTFSQLCILGDDVEPCFEGSEISKPNISSTFSKDDNFSKSLFTMMEELKYTLSNNKEGGCSMDNQETPISTIEEEEEEVVEVETPEVEVETEVIDSEPEVEFVETNKEDKDEDEKTDDIEDESDDEEDEDIEKKYELLAADYVELQKKYEQLQNENKELFAFKEEIEDKQKDEMIESFYMLSEEDKKDVIINKTNYSLDDIKAKLSILCVEKKVDFSIGNKETKEEEQPIVTFSLNETVSNVPAWLKAVEEVRKNKI